MKSLIQEIISVRSNFPLHWSAYSIPLELNYLDILISLQNKLLPQGADFVKFVIQQGDMTLAIRTKVLDSELDKQD